MEFLQQLIGFTFPNLEATVSAVALVMTIFSIVMANFSIYAMCKIYGIPFRITAMNARDSVDSLIELIIVFLIVIFPLFYVFGGLGVWLADNIGENIIAVISFFILFCSTMMGILYTLSKNLRGVLKKVDKKLSPKYSDVVLKIFLFVVPGSIALMFMLAGTGTAFFINISDGLLRALLILLSAICLIAPVGKILCRIILRATGEHDDFFTFTATVDDKKVEYLAILRHSNKQWVCLRCNIIENIDGEKGKVLYSRGEIVIWKTDEMREIKHRENELYHISKMDM
ncbi:MAG: hypothetical protein FWB96_00890 [Defluviitaleaceae bacterium]|nr:hypothetical protein [Defluviitaleaceae bacterium]MCL2262764.1 hypothetical protein [Defluviitaleaceae bacterium]